LETRSKVDDGAAMIFTAAWRPLGVIEATGTRETPEKIDV
jgi:hypothetical protein